MNIIKTLTRYALYFLLVAVAFTSCTDRTERNKINRNDYIKNDVSRINMVETTELNGYRYSIIKIDDKEFFVNANGGVYPLSNCN